MFQQVFYIFQKDYFRFYGFRNTYYLKKQLPPGITKAAFSTAYRETLTWKTGG